MSDRIEVPAHETGVVRMFAVDLPPEEIEDFADPDREGWPLIAALGLYDLNPAYVEIFPVNQLEDMGLTADSAWAEASRPFWDAPNRA